MTLPPFDQPLSLLKLIPLQIARGGGIPDKLLPLPALPDITALPDRCLQLSMSPTLDKTGMQQLMQHYAHQMTADMSLTREG